MSTEGTTQTIGLQEAAKLLQISPDALLRKARAGKVPGAKVGRRWVFIVQDLIQLIRDLAAERRSRSGAVRAAAVTLSGISRSGDSGRLAELKLDARRAQLLLPKSTAAERSGGRS